MASSFGGVKPCKVSPQFLHSNSTSHTWPFSAIAELIDNAYDPDVNATELRIDHRVINNIDTLTFVDDGNGMNEDKLTKMMSFGYSEKVEIGGVRPIGHYGNGFKSGSMRLGNDTIVFTRCSESMSVAMLSQTYLTAIQADCVLVPIVTWDLKTKTRSHSEAESNNIEAIMKHSIFKSEQKLLAELNALGRIKTGTNIIIYNLKVAMSGTFELDFESENWDIRNPESPLIDLSSINRPIHTTTSPEYRRSLRKYCSILYLKPRMKIAIRGRKVMIKLISKCLSKTERDVYKPTWLTKPVKITFGFLSQLEAEPESFGLMMYHKNRLIKAYEKIGGQKYETKYLYVAVTGEMGLMGYATSEDPDQPVPPHSLIRICSVRLSINEMPIMLVTSNANGVGAGVVGVVECDFLETIHNKQDFARTDKYSAFMQNAATKLNDYYNEKTLGVTAVNTTQQTQLPAWTWVQCDNCLKWRRLPTGYTNTLPDKWYCRMNPDAAFNRCDFEAEPEDDDEALQVTYSKTYKKQMEEKRKQTKENEAQKIVEKERLLAQKEQSLHIKEREIHRQSEELATSSADIRDRKLTVADLEHAKVQLNQYQEKLAVQKKTIINLEHQKKEIEHKSAAMLRMAESLKVSNEESEHLLQKVDIMAGTSNTAVTSNSTLPKPHKKRKPNETETTAAGLKKIKTEDGDYVEMLPIDLGSKKFIDLTLDADMDDDDNAGANVCDDSRDTDNDCTGDICNNGKKDTTNLLKLSNLEEKQQLSRELDETKQSLKNLQGNIWNLLKIIVPDFDYGMPENIESIILDFIKVNEDQPGTES